MNCGLVKVNDTDSFTEVMTELPHKSMSFTTKLQLTALAIVFEADPVEGDRIRLVDIPQS